MSGEIIAILGVGVALAGLILTSVRGLRGEIAGLRGGSRGCAARSRGCAASSQRFAARLLNSASAWRTSKGCLKACGKPSPGGQQHDDWAELREARTHIAEESSRI